MAKWLDDLEALVDKLGKRINQYSSRLVKSESSTRYALIDPLLTGLGWDLSDPSQVLTEYSLESLSVDKPKRADYAMGSPPTRPRLLVEAKRLYAPLRDKAMEQAVSYCVTSGADYFVVTDGDWWKGYDVRKRGVPLDEQLVFEFQVTGTEGPRSTLSLLWLWPGNFKGPTISLNDLPKEELKPTPDTPSRQKKLVRRRSGQLPSLAKYRHNKNAKPVSLTFEDGQTVAAQSWIDVQVRTVEWLLGAGHLKISMCPLETGRGNPILLARRPTHSDPTYFKTDREVEGLWIGAWRSAEGHVKAASQIVQKCGRDPNDVLIEVK